MALSESQRVMAELRAFVRSTVVKLTVNVTAELSDSTPRDTGWAASNWIPSVGDKTELPFGSKEAVSETAKELGLLEVASMYALPQLVHITNPVYYILKLNEGSSTQAPRHFVQTAIAKAVRSVV